MRNRVRTPLIVVLTAVGLLAAALSYPQAVLAAATVTPPAAPGAAVSGQSTGTVSTAPPAAAIPDYGGRDSDVDLDQSKGAAASAPDPMGQAFKAVEALLIVLGLVVGAVFLLKRSGFVKSTQPGVPFRSAVARAAASRLSRPAKPRRAPAGPAARSRSASDDQIELLCSQELDENAGLHLVFVNGRTLLLGSCGQALNVLSQWDDAAAAPASEPPAANGAADRLQALLEQSRRSDLRQPFVSTGRGEDRR